VQSVEGDKRWHDGISWKGRGLVTEAARSETARTMDERES